MEASLYKQFMQACTKGDVKTVSRMVGSAIAQTQLREAFIKAATCGHVNILRSLRKDFGVTADDARADHNEALCRATINGHVEVLRVLRKDFGLTADDARTDDLSLRGAVEYGHAEILRALHDLFGLTAEDARSSCDNRAIQWAAANGQVKVLRVLHEVFGFIAYDARGLADLGTLTEVDIREIFGSTIFSPEISLLETEENTSRLRIASEWLHSASALERAFNGPLEVHFEDISDTCAVCLQSLVLLSAPKSEFVSSRTRVTVTACGHAIHEKCIELIRSSKYQSRNACPLCRQRSAASVKSCVVLDPFERIVDASGEIQVVFSEALSRVDAFVAELARVVTERRAISRIADE